MVGNPQTHGDTMGYSLFATPWLPIPMFEPQDNYAYSCQNTPCYMGSAMRTNSVENYKIQRQSFYCPSNLGWNSDDVWLWDNTDSGIPGPSSSPSVIGYFHFAGNAPFNNPAIVGTFYPNSGALPGGDNLAAHQPVLPMKTTDRPYFNLVWSDMQAQYEGDWWRSQALGTCRANHFSKNAPVGANEGSMDGHVEWVKWNKFSTAPRMSYGSLDVFFYGN